MLDEQLYGKVIKCSDENTGRVATMYLNYNLSILYCDETIYGFFSVCNPLKAGLSELTFDMRNNKFLIETEDKEGGVGLYEEDLEAFEFKEGVFKQNIKAVAPSTSKLIYSKPDYIKKIIKSPWYKAVQGNVLEEKLALGL